MYINIVKSYILGYEKKWKQLINHKINNALMSLKKMLAFTFYWTFYYSMVDEHDRRTLF